MTVESIRILTAEHDGEDGLIVAFSDGTTGAYVVEELLALRHIRGRVKTSTHPQNLQRESASAISWARTQAYIRPS